MTSRCWSRDPCARELYSIVVAGLIGSTSLMPPASADTPGRLPIVLPPGDYEPREPESKDLKGELGRKLRDDALRRAQVWRRPARPIREADLGRNPPGPFRVTDEVVCKFLPRKATGTTPKFECVLDGGEVIKVKYGDSPELHAEPAAARLLEALGFGADRMYVVARVRCFGCPADPFVALSCLASPFDERRSDCEGNYGVRSPTGEFLMEVDYGRYSDFDEAVIERRLPGRTMETDNREGWGFDELASIDASRGGAPRAHVDALRLMAVLLNNWDNRADNQRLVCLPGGDGPEGSCRRPFALMHDVGGSFGSKVRGQRKMDLEGWRAVPVWRDPASCLVKVESPPRHGATFDEVPISEPGRRFAARLLRQLSTRQVRDLFARAGFGSADDYEPADVSGWVRAFEEKVRQIADRPPCPRNPKEH